jgi:hypothetical protein
MQAEQGPVPYGTAREALLERRERQRLLRSVYATARYGWPESPAQAWARRPETFVDEQRDRAAVLLERWAGSTARPSTTSPRPPE